MKPDDARAGDNPAFRNTLQKAANPGRIEATAKLSLLSLHRKRVIMTETQLLFSPRLVALQRMLLSGNGAALDLFWQEMETVGTPLIESIPADDSHMLVTFLYRAPLVVRSVEIVCGLTGRGPINEPMTRLAPTSLWYKTYRVSPGLRTEYRILVDGVAQPDQLNSRMLTFPPD